MINGKKLIAIIPARMGSKRLRAKNIKNFRGRPLFVWAIKSAQASKYIDEIFLSTESDKIKKIAKKFGYCTNYLRKPHLAKDSTSANDVILDVLKNLKKKYDYFIYLQATSPLRKIYDIDHSIKKIVSGNYDTLISIDESKNKKKPNGAIYINKIKEFLKYKTLFRNKKTVFYRMPRARSIDIDKVKDFEKALKFSQWIKKNFINILIKKK